MKRLIKKIIFPLLAIWFDSHPWENLLKVFYLKRKYQSKFQPGKDFKLGRSSSISIVGDGQFKTSVGAEFRKFCNILIMDGGKIEMEGHVFFNNYCSLNCLNKITIGENSIFGEGVRIYDHNHKFRDKLMSITQQGYSTSPIIIGKNCWIGSNTVILKGAQIGDNVVIGAGNTISSVIPSGSIVKATQGFTIQNY